MLQKNQFALLLLGLAVVASGCADTTQTTTSQQRGVEVTNFSAIPSEIYDTQAVNLRLRLTNVGGVKATNVKAELFNVPFGDRDKQEWEGSTAKTFNTLRPADPEAGTEAIPKEKTFALTPPDLKEGLNIDYTFMTRVSYDYRTEGVADIQLMTSKRARETNAPRTQPTIDNSAGPVQMDIRTRTPIIFYGSDGNTYSTSSNLCIVAKNTGQGTPYLDSVSNSEKVKLTMQSAGEIKFEAIGNEDGNTATVELIGGTGRQCFELKNFGFSATEDIQRTIPLTVTADYGYYMEEETTVTVKGRGTGGAPSGTTNDESPGTTSWSWDATKSDGMWAAASNGGEKTEAEACQWLAEEYSESVRDDYCSK